VQTVLASSGSCFKKACLCLLDVDPGFFSTLCCICFYLLNTSRLGSILLGMLAKACPSLCPVSVVFYTAAFMSHVPFTLSNKLRLRLRLRLKWRAAMKADRVNARCARVSRCINDVHATRLQTWQDQSGPRLGRIRVTAGARVPAAVMELVTDIRHLQTMNHLAHTRPTSLLLSLLSLLLLLLLTSALRHK